MLLHFNPGLLSKVLFEDQDPSKVFTWEILFAQNLSPHMLIHLLLLWPILVDFNP